MTQAAETQPLSVSEIICQMPAIGWFIPEGPPQASTGLGNPIAQVGTCGSPRVACWNGALPGQPWLCMV